jgi:hypothetical protein
MDQAIHQAGNATQDFPSELQVLELVSWCWRKSSKCSIASRKLKLPIWSSG